MCFRSNWSNMTYLVVTDFPFSSTATKTSIRVLAEKDQTRCSSYHDRWLKYDLWSRHWQESRSRKISRRNDSIFSRSLEKIKFSLLFLFSIFKIVSKKIYFSSRFMRLLNPFYFCFLFSRFFRKNSLSLLGWWDSETQILFSSRFSRFWENFLLFCSIHEIFKNYFFLLLELQF